MGIAQYDASRIMKFAGGEEGAQLSLILSPERKKYFDGIGVNVSNVHDLDTAMRLSGLNFEVEKRPIAFYDTVIDGDTGLEKTKMREVKGKYATVRTDTMEPLGVVGDKYNILSNREAFDFLDSIVGSGQASFETAGMYDGAKSFITIKTENKLVLGEEYSPYILLINSFDGTGAVRAMFTDIRIFCSNCLARAIKGASNKVSIQHSNMMREKLESARVMLQEHEKSFEAYKKEAEKLAKITYSRDQFINLVDELIPRIPAEKQETTKEFVKQRIEDQRNALIRAYDMDDLQNFNNTAYKVVQAIADYESHPLTVRRTEKAHMAAMKNVVNGMPLLNAVTNRLINL